MENLLMFWAIMNNYFVKILNLFLLFFFFFLSHESLAVDCGDASGTTTISTNCTSLNIIGDGSNVTIDSEVTINATRNIAVKSADATNATITNNGTITAPNNDAFRNNHPGHVSNLINNGSITATNNGVKNDGRMDILTNTGTISVGADSAIKNFAGSGRTMGTLTNTASGTISAGDDFGIRNDGIIETIINYGTIHADDDNGFWTKGTITTLTNKANATISAGDDNAIKVVLGSEVGTITNAGLISAGGDFGIRNDRSNSKESKITVLTNSGTISAGTSSGIWNDGEIVTLTNTADAFIKATSGDYGIKNVNTGEIGLLDNSGTISAGDDWGIYNDAGAKITSLRNTGTISAAGNSISIFNDVDSSIVTLSNLQGKTTSALTYDKKLPTYYKVIVDSASNFGMVTFTNVYGTTTFGVDGTSTLGENTYNSVILGLSSDDISSGTSGTHTNPDACTKAHGTSITLSTNCAELDISGSGSNITIDSGVTISGDGDFDWTLVNSSGTTWNLVSEAQLDDVVNTGTDTTLNNSGTITAEASGANGILNQGNFAIITNKGSITSDSAYGINNTGTITTLINLQGASSSALTYNGKLPSNYNVIVNSTSNFGKVTFSNVSGTTNFGVDSTSTLVSDTTYSSVINGLTSSDIAAGTSGSHVSGSIRNDWTLTNSSGSLWDLVVAPDEDITDDTEKSVKRVGEGVVVGMNNMTSVIEVNFANMNTYDCELFDKSNICLSLGARYTAITNPKTETESTVVVGGYKLSDTIRVAAFYHKNLSHKTPATFELTDKTPLTGLVIVWNQNANYLGYQLKIANASQKKNASVIRKVVGSSEEGKGKTVIEAKSYIAELQYGYKYSNRTILSPYLASRSAVIKQDAYKETGLSSPLTFNEIKDKSFTILPGLKFKTNLNKKVSLRGSLGLEYDINHTIDKLAPTGISGLSKVSLTDDYNQIRPVVSLGSDYALKSNHRISSTLQYQELPYDSKSEFNAYLYYTIGF